METEIVKTLRIRLAELTTEAKKIERAIAALMPDEKPKAAPSGKKRGRPRKETPDDNMGRTPLNTQSNGQAEA